MALLLDTQIIIWIEESPQKIPDTIKEKISLESEVYFSKASVWEMAIKIKIEKLILKQQLALFITNFQHDYNFRLLDITLAHIYQTDKLELLHKDPFDRLLIAQSIVEKISIISSDTAFDAYGIHRIW